MGERAVGKRGKAEQQAAARPEELEDKFARRLSLLLGLVPLAEMTQDETDWVFEKKCRAPGDD